MTPASTPNSVLVIFPNPSNGTQPTQVQLNLTQVSDVKIQIFTIAFRKVGEQTFSQVPPGGKVTLSLTDRWGSLLANGLYYIRVEVTGMAPVTKILRLLVLR